MKAMGQMGHLWNTSQCDVWMCDLMELDEIQHVIELVLLGPDP